MAHGLADILAYQAVQRPDGRTEPAHRGGAKAHNTALSPFARAVSLLHRQAHANGADTLSRCRWRATRADRRRLQANRSEPSAQRAHYARRLVVVLPVVLPANY